MAFFNRKMAGNKELIKAWKSGHQRKLDEGEEIHVPEICDEIARWMRRDRRPRSRLSLRSFSVLLSGTIRLYRDQVNHLLKDTLNYSLFKKPATPKPSLGTENQETSTSGKTFSNSNGDQSKLTEKNPNSTNSPQENNFDEDMSDESTVFTVSPNNNQQNNVGEVHEKKKEKRDQIIQTQPTPESDIGNTSGFDPNLPFGYIIVHDNFHSRIPSKILLSSLNENINFYPFADQ